MSRHKDINQSEKQNGRLQRKVICFHLELNNKYPYAIDRKKTGKGKVYDVFGPATETALSPI